MANRELGVLVNNVGVMGAHFMPYLDMQQEDVEDMIRVNTITAAEVSFQKQETNLIFPFSSVTV